MDIYFKKRRWKQLILVFAILIGIGSLFYTQNLVEQASKEERSKIERWAEAIRLSVHGTDLSSDVVIFLDSVKSDNTTTPIILVEENGEINFSLNINYTPRNKEKVLARKLDEMKSRQVPIVIDLGNNVNQYLYYSESWLLVQLKYYPYIQLGVIAIFIFIAYYSFSTAKKTEQNLVWIGMAKETAHQLGTPISSLLAWIELLKEENLDPNIISELEKDAERLGKITERFSKIGSIPELYPENLHQVLTSTLTYLQNRVSKKIEFEFIYNPSKELYLPLTAPLFSWVIENLIRNSVDSIEDKHGKITIEVTEKEKDVIIDVTDNGKGVPKSKQKAIFQPGYTTKKRGWGLGLSLAKRIVEIYHNGKIMLKNSEPYKATTFRIVLNKFEK